MDSALHGRGPWKVIRKKGAKYRRAAGRLQGVLDAVEAASDGYPQKLWITLWTIHQQRCWHASADAGFSQWSNFNQ
jgi:hypothetical protein